MTAWPDAVVKFADAIKVAEGSPPDWNNPGSLKLGDAGGFATCGMGNSEGVVRFVNYDDGWNALCLKVSRMLAGRSRVYPLSRTLTEVGAIYSGGDPNWAKNVAAELGVPETTTLAELAGLDDTSLAQGA